MQVCNIAKICGSLLAHPGEPIDALAALSSTQMNGP
jgi:hypothetical protein